MSTCVLYLVRHGETEGNSRVRLNGATDVPLSPLGRQQMAAARDYLGTVAVHAAYSSPLSRSSESAHIVRGESAYPIHVVREFREIHFGLWETLTFREVAERYPADHKRYLQSNRDFAFPGGESQVAFRERIHHAAASHLKDAVGPVVAALHKGVIKEVTSYLLDQPVADQSIAPCDLGSITVLERTGSTWELVQFGFTEHLGALHQPD